MSKFIIYHNPRCSKSREALEIIRQNNLDHQIKLYLEDPLTSK
jgi:arsenate reductase